MLSIENQRYSWTTFPSPLSLALTKQMGGAEENPHEVYVSVGVTTVPQPRSLRTMLSSSN